MRHILHEADDLLPATQEGSTLVIHKADPSTDFLTAIYDGKGYPVIRGNIRRQELAEEIKKYDRIFMLGHGSPGGLFGDGYMIGDDFGPLLATKTGLYIWCHAVEYAHYHKLTGLVSGMFISEVGEAAYMGIRATQEQVDASNAAFSKAVRHYLDTGGSPHEVRNCYSSATCQVTKYNNERLYVMEHGTILDSLGQPQPDEVSAKQGSPRYWKAHPEPEPDWLKQARSRKERSPKTDFEVVRQDNPYDMDDLDDLDFPEEDDYEPLEIRTKSGRTEIYNWRTGKWDPDPGNFKFESQADEPSSRLPEFHVDDLIGKASKARGTLTRLQRHPSVQGRAEIQAKIAELMGKMDQRDTLLHQLRFSLPYQRELKRNNTTMDQVEWLIPGRESRFGERPASIAGVKLKDGRSIMFTMPIKYPAS